MGIMKAWEIESLQVQKIVVKQRRDSCVTGMLS